MFRVAPIAITDEVLVASSLAEDDYPAWSAAGDYDGPPAPNGLGERVIRTETHSVYEALQDVGPSATPPEDDPDNWLKVCATNKWQPFDYYLADQAVGDDISYTLAPSTVVDSLLIFNARCTSITVVVTNGLDTLMDETFAMEATVTPTDFFSWIWAVPEAIPSRAIPLAFLPGSEIEVTFNGSNVAVGQIVLGLAERWGDTTWAGTSFTHRDFSSVDPDRFGIRKGVPRDGTFDFNFHVEVEPKRVPLLMNRVQAARGKVAAYLSTRDALYGQMSLGFMTKMGLDYRNPKLSKYQLQIEGLV